MKNILLIVFTICVSCSCSINVFGQAPMPIVEDFDYQYGSDYEIPFIGTDGNIVFTLGAGYKFIRKKPLVNGDFSPKSLDVFSEDILIIKAGRKFQWMDKKGGVVKYFEKLYSNMTPFVNGYCMAWKPIPDKYRETTVVFLNKLGENAFGTKEFSQADNFSEGLAPVKLQENGTWGYIDESGEIILELQDYISKHISRLHSFSDGLAKVEIYGETAELPLNYVFIDKEGKTIFDLQKKYPNRKIKRIDNFSEGLVGISFLRSDKSKDVVFLDKKGEELIVLEKVSNYGAFRNGITFFAKQFHPINEISFEYTFHTLDKEGNVKLFVLEGGEKIDWIYEEDGYVEIKLEDKYKGYHKEALYQLNPLKKIYTTKNNSIVGYSQNHILLYDNDAKGFSLRKMDGTLIWGTMPEKREFTAIEKALQNKYSVKKYELRDSTDFDKGLYQLTNLEHLVINYSKLNELPNDLYRLRNLKSLELKSLPNITILPKEIGKMLNLKKIVIDNLDNVSSIPEEIGMLRNLEELTISDLPLLTTFPKEIGSLQSLKKLSFTYLKRLDILPSEIAQLRNMEEIHMYKCNPNRPSLRYIIENAPALKRTYFDNYHLETWFREKMKKLRPHLVLGGRSWIGGDVIEQIEIDN